MAPDVLELVEQFYRTHRTKTAVQIAFVDRSAEAAFASVGRAAVAAEPLTIVASWTDTELVWLGYELVVDSAYLANLWK